MPTLVSCCQNEVLLVDLPTEVLVNILLNIHDVHQLVNCALVCQRSVTNITFSLFLSPYIQRIHPDFQSFCNRLHSGEQKSTPSLAMEVQKL